MFAARYYPQRQFATRYFPKIGAVSDFIIRNYNIAMKSFDAISVQLRANTGASVNGEIEQ
jgi:hypothetical protein